MKWWQALVIPFVLIWHEYKSVVLIIALGGLVYLAYILGATA